MKITKIQYSNIRGFEHLEIHLDTTSNILITGNNGNGKTTFLRALSMTFCDEMGAAGLLSELPGQFITYGKSKGTVLVELENSEGLKIRIETKIFDRFGTEQVRKYYSTWDSSGQNWKKQTEAELSKLDEIPHTNLFTVAYGTCLRILGKERYNNYYSADAVYSLFKIDTLLQEQELTIRRLLDEAEKSSNKNLKHLVENNIMSMIGRMLSHGDDPNIKLEGNGIFFGADKEYPSELTTKGDGVRAVVTMVLDLMAWWYLYLLDNDIIDENNFHDTSNISGVVMIDEVALYLHPSWQRNIIGNFIQAFPNVQFIFTTHAPLCVSGATDFGDKIKFIRFSKLDKYSQAEEYHLPRGYSTDEILTSMAFGLPTSMSPEIEKKLNYVADSVLGKTTPLSTEDVTLYADEVSTISKSLGRTVWHDLIQKRMQSNLTNLSGVVEELGTPEEVRGMLSRLDQGLPLEASPIPKDDTAEKDAPVKKNTKAKGGSEGSGGAVA